MGNGGHDDLGLGSMPGRGRFLPPDGPQAPASTSHTGRVSRAPLRRTTETGGKVDGRAPCPGHRNKSPVMSRGNPWIRASGFCQVPTPVLRDIPPVRIQGSQEGVDRWAGSEHGNFSLPQARLIPSWDNCAFLRTFTKPEARSTAATARAPAKGNSMRTNPRVRKGRTEQARENGEGMQMTGEERKEVRHSSYLLFPKGRITLCDPFTNPFHRYQKPFRYLPG